MAIGTIDRTPPPFFRQGPSALTKLTFCSALALFLMVADTRFRITQPLRAAAAAVLHPVQRTLLVPVELISGTGDYLLGLHAALGREEAARIELARQAERAMRAEQLLLENKRLRACSSCGRASTSSRRPRRSCTKRPTRIRARCSSTAARATALPWRRRSSTRPACSARSRASTCRPPKSRC